MELVKIVFNDDLNVNSVDARELHNVLEVGTEFSHWIKKRIVDTMAEENVDFSIVKKKNVPGKFGKLQDLIVIILSLNLAKEIAMLERNEIGRKVRKYFIQCESELKAQPKIVARTKGDKACEFHNLVLEVVIDKRASLEGNTDHKGYCINIAKVVNTLYFGTHDPGIRQYMPENFEIRLNAINADVARLAIKGVTNPKQVYETLAPKYTSPLVEVSKKGGSK